MLLIIDVAICQWTVAFGPLVAFTEFVLFQIRLKRKGAFIPRGLTPIYNELKGRSTRVEEDFTHT